MSTDNPAAGIENNSVSVEPENELAYFALCPECGQAFDKREPEEILHHRVEGHQPYLTH